MIEYSGSAAFGGTGTETVTGRLTEVGNGTSACAAILICGGETEIRADAVENAVGIVLTHADEAYAQKLAELYGIPVLLLLRELEHGDKNKIAILDPTGRRLYVNPDLGAVCALLGEEKKAHAVPVTRIAVCGGERIPVGFDGISVGKLLERDIGEEEAYEYFCGTADVNTGSKIVASVFWDSNERLFSARVRSVYRASVWGRFSLLCRGISTSESAEHCISVLRSARAELETEGRELDASMKIGASVSTPVRLLSPVCSEGFDFYCLDIDVLLDRFCASDNMECDLPHIIPYIKEFAVRTSAQMLAFSSERGFSAEVSEQLSELGIPIELYVPYKKY